MNRLRNRVKVLESRLTELNLSYDREREQVRQAAVQAELRSARPPQPDSRENDIDVNEVQSAAASQLEEMKEKDRIHLEEIKRWVKEPRARPAATGQKADMDRLLQEKIELQSAAIEQKEKLLLREKEFGYVSYLQRVGGIAS